MGCILLNQDCVYAKDTATKGIEVINLLYNLGPPTLLTAVDFYKVRAYIKMHIKNLKFYLQTPIST